MSFPLLFLRATRLSSRAIAFTALLTGLASVGCDLSPTDPPVTQATLSGTLTYSGPRPMCDGNDVKGQVVVQLFAGAGVNPRDGRPAAESFEVIPGEDVFNVPEDCGSAGPPIVREVDYSLENVGPALGQPADQVYRLVAFWDADENFVGADPFLDQPSRGDRFGGAFGEGRRYRTIQFERPGASPNGQLLRDVAVTIDAEVHSELPMFSFAPGRTPLSAEAVMPAEDDPAAQEQAVFELTNLTMELLPLDDGDTRSTLLNAGISVDSDPMRRGFWSLPLDPERSGVPSKHPLSRLSMFDFVWQTPAPVLLREQSEAETATGVPNVYLFPAQRPSEAAKEIFAPTLDLLVYPVAFVNLNPDVPVCRFPIVAPGNAAPMYEGLAVDCQEIPTGNYTATVGHGAAGGMTAAGVPAEISDTGFRVTGSEYVGQTWRIPNDLGGLLNAQGQAGQFMVTDPEPTNGPDPLSMTDGHGIESCVMAPDPEMEGMTRSVSYMSVPSTCCEPVVHLCGIPLCEPVMTSQGAIRQATTRTGNTPNCLPFLMPPSCCLGT